LDVLYHVTNVIQTKAIETSILSISLHGEGDMIKSIQELLSKHYHQVQFCGRISGIHYPDELYQQPTHHFFNLISALACVS
jgi:hypothetical protein